MKKTLKKEISSKLIKTIQATLIVYDIQATEKVKKNIEKAGKRIIKKFGKEIKKTINTKLKKSTAKPTLTKSISLNEK